MTTDLNCQTMLYVTNQIQIDCDFFLTASCLQDCGLAVSAMRLQTACPQLDVNQMPDKSSGATKTVWLGEKSSTISEDALHFTKLNRNLECDVCVVGAGQAGLHCAYELTLAGKKVVVIEDGFIASGETGRTTGHLSTIVDDRLSEIASMFGEKGAQIAYESHSAAVDRIEQIVNTEKIECQFERVNGYLIEGRDVSDPEYQKNAKMLDEEYEWAKRVGFEGCAMVDNPQHAIPGINSGRTVKYPKQGQYQPVKYLNGLAKAIVRRGGQIYTSTHATGLNGSLIGKAQVVTVEGFHVDCDHIISATFIPTKNTISIVDRVSYYRSYVIAATVPKNSVEHSLVWDLSEPYHYVRITSGPDNGDHDIIVVGGEDEKVGVKGADEQIERFKRLEDWMRQRYPMAGKVTNQWSGQIIEPVDYMALIGQNPHDFKNVLICTGDSGDGMTHGVIAGMLLKDLIIKGNSPWAWLYSPTRKPIKALPGYIKHNLDVGAKYTRWLSKSDSPEVKDIKDLKPCTGATLLINGKHTACYKDADGVVHRYSAVCPHMHQIVTWNALEHSFDCSAHGSRFSHNGQVLCGPANRGLAPPEQAW